jgi:hypothetical protein
MSRRREGAQGDDVSDIFIVDVDPADETASVARTKRLVVETGAPSVAFMATAVPNGEDLRERLHDWVHRYALLRDGLAGIPVRVGILVQALIGHGDRHQTVKEVPFQKIVGDDGTASRECFCPLDRDFQAYTKTLISTLARERPVFMMIDDDFRIAFHGPAVKGCMCPLHLARFGEATGTSWTRESLVAGLRDAERPGLRTQWEELTRDSLVEHAAVIRAAIDSVDPSIEGSLCTVIGEAHFAQAIADTLAGRHRPLVRIHNATYLENGQKRFPVLLTRTRHEIAVLRPETTVLTEADTCPHSRYSLSRKTHLAHLTATTLFGCKGGKYWFIKADEEGARDTEPFAAMLPRVRPFLDEIGRIRDRVAWEGPRVAARMKEVYLKPYGERGPLDAPSDEWGSRIFGRMGVAFAVADSAPGPRDGTSAMSCAAPWGFDDAEILEFLKRPLLLDGEAAWLLAKRGFSRHLGVTVEPTSAPCTAEILHAIPESPVHRETMTGMTGDGRYLLSPASPATRIVSSYVSGTKARFTRDSPGLTWYENELGGRVAVYGLSMRASLDWMFYNGKRKRQLLETLTWLGRGTGPVVADTDLDVLLLHGRDTAAPDRRYLAVFDLNPDTVEGLAVRLPGRPARSVERLSPAARWDRVGFSQDGETVRISLDVPTMEPCVLRLES